MGADLPAKGGAQLPKIELTDEERRALADLVREYVRTERYPLAPGLAPIRGGADKTGAERRPAETAIRAAKAAAAECAEVRSRYPQFA